VVLILLQQATSNLQPAMFNKQLATRNLQHVTSDKQQATSGLYMIEV
jgi:hypothetical protein